eukprot:5915779-Prorocentrum_lima.AAC.1
MYPARQLPPVVDLTQPDPEDAEEGDDAPVHRPEDPPELDEPDDMQGLINAGRCPPNANQEEHTGAASSAATSAVPATNPPLTTVALPKPLPP